VARVDAIVASRVDYSNIVLVGSSSSRSDRQTATAVDAAVRLVSGTRKYDRGLMQFLYADLNWLDVAGRVMYKLDVTVHQCLHNKRRSICQTAVSQSQTSSVVSD